VSTFDQPPNIKFPSDPALDEGRKETEIARLGSGSQAKRSVREGHDASRRRISHAGGHIHARGVTLVIA